MILQKVVGGIERWEGVGEFRFQLVWTRHRLQLLPSVEHSVGELCNFRMHSSLAAQDADEFAALLMVFPANQTLEEGVAAVGETDVL